MIKGPRLLRLPKQRPILTFHAASLLAPSFDHLQHRPSRAALCLRVTCQRSQRQAENQLVEFVDVYGELIGDISARQAILPQCCEDLLEDL